MVMLFGTFISRKKRRPMLLLSVRTSTKKGNGVSLTSWITENYLRKLNSKGIIKSSVSKQRGDK
jgi:hypothetical protein